MTKTIEEILRGAFPRLIPYKCFDKSELEFHSDHDEYMSVAGKRCRRCGKKLKDS